MNKRGSGATVLLGIVVIVLGIVWMFALSERECNANTDCEENFYCGSDFACHEHPYIEKQPIVINYWLPALILGIAIIVAAFILKRKPRLQPPFNGYEEIKKK